MAKKIHSKGLSAEQVIASRQQYGPNIITPPAREPLWRQFIKKFDDPLIKILLVALALSVGLSVYEYFWLHMGASIFFEPLGIFLAVVLATLVGFLVEVNANKKFRLLNQSDDGAMVKVLRSGHITQVARRESASRRYRSREFHPYRRREFVHRRAFVVEDARNRRVEP